MQEKLDRFYQDLHQIPELGDQLPQTKLYIVDILSDLDCQLTYPSPSSVCAFFNANQEDTVAIRTDMDALPIQEANTHDHISKHAGCMHACGHDGHMAMVLGLALELHKYKHVLPMNVLLIFQPAEETAGGAEAIVNSGILDTYNVSNIFGFHIWPGFKKGQIYTKEGAMMARSSEVDIDIYGKSTHCANAEHGIDALELATDFLQKTYKMINELSRKSFCLLKFGKFKSGVVRNAISAQSHLEGTLRVFDDNVYFEIMMSMKKLSKEMMERTGCKINLHFSKGYPIVFNDPETTKEILKQFPDIKEMKEPVLQAEDFAYYQTSVPGVFFFLGTGEDNPLHSDTFHFDTSILQIGLNFYKELLSIDTED